MKILLSPDKFRGSASALEVCQWLEEGLKRANPELQITSKPMADGGEGTFQILTQIAGGSIREVEVYDPLGRPIRSFYGLVRETQTAYIEMAMASGLALLAPNERNPLDTSTIGTGQLIADAMQQGATRIVIGIGGSATNDGGMGMAHALGFRFYNRTGATLTTGRQLLELDRIDIRGAHPLLAQCTFVAACDVKNPLFGPQGAAYIFAPQKGAKPDEVELLDYGLQNFAQVCNRKFGRAVEQLPGSGAAGGLGAGLQWFLNARLESGIEVVLRETHMEETIAQHDVVITGEGMLDRQSLQGKVIWGVGNLARKLGKQVILACGTTTLNREQLFDKYTSGLYAITDLATDQRDAMTNARHYLIAIGQAIGHKLKLSE